MRGEDCSTVYRGGDRVRMAAAARRRSMQWAGFDQTAKDNRLYPLRLKVTLSQPRLVQCDQQAILPVLAMQPEIDFVAEWEAPTVHEFLPMAQNAPDQPPLFFHLLS